MNLTRPLGLKKTEISGFLSSQRSSFHMENKFSNSLCLGGISYYTLVISRSSNCAIFLRACCSRMLSVAGADQGQFLPSSFEAPTKAEHHPKAKELSHQGQLLPSKLCPDHFLDSVGDLDEDLLDDLLKLFAFSSYLRLSLSSPFQAPFLPPPVASKSGKSCRLRPAAWTAGQPWTADWTTTLCWTEFCCLPMEG